MFNTEDTKVNYSMEWKKHVIAYTFGWDRWYWLSFNDDFDEIADMLLKCNDDVKKIKAKMNRIMWLAETIVWEWFGITQKRDTLFEAMIMVEFQMYMVTQSVFSQSKKIFKRLQKDPLTSKLFPND